MDPTREELISKVAYDIWIEAGRPDGHAETHWAMAEEKIVSTFTIDRSIHSTYRTCSVNPRAFAPPFSLASIA
jgi:hypothetical protein